MVDNEKNIINISDKSMLKTLQEIELKGLKFKSKHINYFIELAKDYMHREKLDDIKRVGIIGTSIPEELVIACGAKPVWILGGSFDCANYADSMVARDTDPMVKSSLGMLLSEAFPSFNNIDLLVIPLTSDSIRKAAYMFSKSFNTFLVDIPPVKNRESSFIKWRYQLKEMTERICELTGKKLKNGDIAAAGEIVYKAKMQTQRFINNHKKNKNLLSVGLYVLILNSYFMTNDLENWTNHLECLNNEIEKASKMQFERHDIEIYKPDILLTGSSIFFPNMKIPSLFDDCGLNICEFEVEMMSYLYTIPDMQKRIFKNNGFTNISDTYYRNNTSQAFVNNKTKISNLQKSLLSSNVEGVVYHVIRGQVGCDFEFESIENFFIERDIPILRLETDYNYQDIEQLRIRLEAFGEMIKSKHNRKINQERIHTAG